MALWESTDKRLLPRDAAGRFVGETFDGRQMDPATFRGGWAGRAAGEWTFRLVDGIKTYRLTFESNRWQVTEVTP